MVGVLFAGLLVSGVPDAKPDHTFVHAGASYDVYVVEADNAYSVEVCARYQLTGTRITRNTCSGPVAQEPTNLVKLRQDDDQLSASQVFHRRANAAARAGNALVNTNTEVKVFWNEVAQAIKEG